jgi:hypothetical protein
VNEYWLLKVKLVILHQPFNGNKIHSMRCWLYLLCARPVVRTYYSFFSINHVTKKHKFVDSIFLGFAKIYSCCLRGVNIEPSNKNVNISKYSNNQCCSPSTHAWTPEKNRLIIIILQCNTEHKNVILHIPGLKIQQIKIPRNFVDVFGTLTIWRHMKTSSSSFSPSMWWSSFGAEMP